MNVLCSSLSDIRAKSVIVVLRILASDTMMWLNPGKQFKKDFYYVRTRLFAG